jgi:hypothetical protein
MAFLSPWFLAGLLALALPLWLHRLERQAAERRPWSSLTFFRASTEESVRRRRLRYLALLTCRLLLLAALALLFARPTVDAGFVLSPPAVRRHLIAVDTSLSLGHGDAWARAQTAAAAVLGGLGADDRSQVVAFGPGVRVLGGATGDHGSWRGAIRALAPTASHASYGELGEALRALALDDPSPLSVHVVSDLQQSAAPDRFADLGLPAGATLLVHDVAAAGRPNWCVEGISGSLRLYGTQRAELHVTIAGFDTPATARRVEVRLGDRVVGAADVNVPASGRATVRFADIEAPRGSSRVEVRLAPADALPADDAFFVALERTESLPILFLRAPSDTRAELYYRAALESAGSGMFEVQAATPDAAQTLALDRFAFVVLYDVSRLPALLDGRLRTFVEGGKAALLVAGASVARDRVWPWLARPLAEAGRRERSLQASVVQGMHPALHDTGRLADVRFFRHVPLAADAERVLVRLADGAPLVLEQPLGAGRLLVLASPLDPEWTDWPVHVSFVPFAIASARWLAGLEDQDTQAIVDHVLDLGRGTQPAAASVQVLDPAGRRALSLEASVSEGKVPLRQAGFYEVIRPGRTTLIAVNPDPRESDLRVMSADALERWKATGGAPAAAHAATGKPERRDLSRYILWFLVAAALVESTLANRYLRNA